MKAFLVWNLASYACIGVAMSCFMAYSSIGSWMNFKENPPVVK